MKKFALTFIDKDGLRVHYAENAGRRFFNGKKAGEKQLTDMLTNNSEDTIKSIFGVNPQFKVIPIECYPNGDAIKNVFES